MLKYVETQVTFAEIPDEISLCINISQCPFECKGCHSPHLREDIGEPLNEGSITRLIKSNVGITAICFMGGDLEPYYINRMAAYVREFFPQLKIGWYSGEDSISVFTEYKNFDFIKLGPYKKKKGGLDSINTNQRFYKVEPDGILRNMTHQFWIRKTDV